jgi:hypothetical protein
MFTAMLLLGSCKKENNSSPATNHVINIENQGTLGPPCVAKQFTSLTLTPTDGSSAAVTYTYVANASCCTSTPVNVTLPKTTTFKLEVFSSSGQKIWWNNMAMAVSGTTRVILVGNGGNFTLSSSCNFIPADGSTLTCP